MSPAFFGVAEHVFARREPHDGRRLDYRTLKDCTRRTRYFASAADSAAARRQRCARRAGQGCAHRQRHLDLPPNPRSRSHASGSDRLARIGRSEISRAIWLRQRLMDRPGLPPPPARLLVRPLALRPPPIACGDVGVADPQRNAHRPSPIVRIGRVGRLADRVWRQRHANDASVACLRAPASPARRTTCPACPMQTQMQIPVMGGRRKAQLLRCSGALPASLLSPPSVPPIRLFPSSLCALKPYRPVPSIVHLLLDKSQRTITHHAGGPSRITPYHPTTCFATPPPPPSFQLPRLQPSCA